MNSSLSTTHIGFQFVMTLAAVIGVGSACLAAPDITLYDVDFDGPPHVVGSTPAFGAGAYPRNTPTAGGQIGAPLGTAEVVPTPLAMPDPPRPTYRLGRYPEPIRSSAARISSSI